jgi:hypothetical protein
MSAASESTTVLAGITRELEGVLSSVTELREEWLRVLVAAGALERAPRSQDLAALHPLIANVLRRHDGFAAGAGVVLAPDVLPDAPRWIEWWWADRGSGIERLEVDLDPGSAEFYDYTTSEWYSEPERTREVSVAGPYVDYICTHTYTYTLSLPMIHRGRFVGVAGADILAEQVEHTVLPELTRLGRVTVLASGNGRIIASNTERLLPGAVLARQEASSELLPIAGPGSTGAAPATLLPWTLFEGPPLTPRAR